MTSTMADARPLTQRLREDNADIHHQAEHDALPQAMVKGEVSREAYVWLLGQLWVGAEALDAALMAVRESVPAIRDLVKAHQLQAGPLREDLAYYGVDTGSVEPCEAVAAMVAHAELARDNRPLELLGMHYVREGANNGNRFIAMKLRKAWGVEGSDGFRHLDPYGHEQRGLWEAWKAELGEYGFSEDEKAAVLEGARAMFRHIMAINRSVALG